jgi:hypothetical protein
MSASLLRSAAPICAAFKGRVCCQNQLAMLPVRSERLYKVADVIRVVKMAVQYA